MANLVLVQNPNSPYLDRPGELYHFPKQYLSRMESAVGDWVIVYEGRKGAFGYVGVQRISRIERDPALDGHFFAHVEPGSLIEFSPPVPRETSLGIAYETRLRGADGRPTSGGQNVSAVRTMDEQDFWQIVNAGLPRDSELPRTERTGEFAEATAPFEPFGERRDVLTSRKYRDRRFSAMVREAYSFRCAVSGLSLRNGGPEVQAAHIIPVAEGGHDIVQNGIAMSATLHWMFDHGS